MSHLRLLLTRKEKILLLNGYIRQNIDKFIPSVLIELVRLFYNNLRSLRIDGNNLDDFLFCGKPMVTEMFSINEYISYKNIKFRMGVYPNGLRKNKQDAIEFYIKLKSLQHDDEQQQEQQEEIEAIQIYYELYCQETQCEWKGVIKMSLNQYIVWSPYIMRLSECKENQYKSLFFSSDIKILSLYFKNGKITQITKPTIMNKNENYCWNINDKYILNKLYTVKYGYCYFSNNFGGNNNDNWCCKYYPEGMKSNDFRGAIFIRLLRKPINIKKVKIKYKILFNHNLIIEEIKEFDDKKHSNGYWLKKLSLIQNQNKYSLQFNINIDILEIYDYNDKIIKNKEWIKYNVTRLKPF